MASARHAGVSVPGPQQQRPLEPTTSGLSRNAVRPHDACSRLARPRGDTRPFATSAFWRRTCVPWRPSHIINIPQSMVIACRETPVPLLCRPPSLRSAKTDDLKPASSLLRAFYWGWREDLPCGTDPFAFVWTKLAKVHRAQASRRAGCWPGWPVGSPSGSSPSPCRRRGARSSPSPPRAGRPGGRPR